MGLGGYYAQLGAKNAAANKTATTKAAADKAAAAAKAAADKAAANVNNTKLQQAAQKAAEASAKAAAAAKTAYDTSPEGRLANANAMAAPAAPVALPQAATAVPSTAQSIFGASSPALGGAQNSAVSQARDLALLQGADAAGKSNESQFQDTNKLSGFASQGFTQQNQTQDQTQKTDSTQNQQTQQNQTGTATGQSTSKQRDVSTQQQQDRGVSNQQQQSVGTQNTQQQNVNTGTQNTGVVDSLNFGKLLQNQGDSAKAATGTQQTFLTDLVENGDPAFNQKMDTAIRASQSGAVQGAGESAKARMGAYAAEKVSQDNQLLRLNAAQQLAGPTAVTTLAGAGNPYLGQTTANTNVGNTTGTVANANTTNTAAATANNSNTRGTNVSNNTQNTAQQTANTNNTNSATQSSQLQDTLSKLLSNESSNQQGVSQGLTSINSVGKQPVQSSGGGMSVICTVLKKHGLLDPELVRAEVVYFRGQKDRHFNAWKAYYAWGRGFARWLVGKPIAMGLTAAIVKRLIAVPAGRGGFVAKLLWHTLLFGHHVAGWFIKDCIWDQDLYEQSLALDTNLFTENK